MPSSSTPQQLVDLISQAVKDIEADVATQIPDGKITDLNQATVAAEDNLEMTAQRRAGLRTLKAATHQLLAAMMPIGFHLQELHGAYLQTVALNVALKARLADLIHSIDPDSSKGGVPIDLLAQKAQMEPRKLTHILRFLALRNVFVEISPNHWANNRASLPLRSDSSNSQHNFLMHLWEEAALPAFVKLPDVLLDNQGGAAFSWDPQQSAFQRYYEPGCDFWEFLARSENGYRAERFGKAMIEGTRALGLGPEIYKGFDWSGLGSNGVLIDVGGGIGAAAYPISSHLPGWKVVIQDRAEAIKNGKENYRKIGSTAPIEFEEADFFKAQPAQRVEMADAYFLQHILHDWPVDSCVQILTHLRKAAKLTTRLLVCEAGVEPALPSSGDSPLLSNGGMAMALSSNFALTMMSCFNGEERSKDDFAEIFSKSGWKLEKSTQLTTIMDRFIFEGVVDLAWNQ